VHLVSCGGALTHFSCKLGLKKFFFTALGGAGAPTAPPGYAYALNLPFFIDVTLQRRFAQRVYLFNQH